MSNSTEAAPDIPWPWIDEEPPHSEERAVPPGHRMVGIQVYVHPSGKPPRHEECVPTIHVYTARIDLVSINATVFGYGDTPEQALHAATAIAPEAWHDGIAAATGPVLKKAAEQIAATGTTPTTAAFPCWAMPEDAWPDWPDKPLKSFVFTDGRLAVRPGA
jgi:hypothetical protein